MHPNLGLHNAAATGNIGLVKFALDNGQPHTSVLNGLLPLHAACSGGSEAVVRLLLGYGADVNSLRLKTPKGASLGPGTGTEGSTPLHFAAANGHTPIVRLLVEHGARPTACDKDGLTPESLATAQGHAACVSLLRSWITAYGPNGLAGIVPGTSNSANPAVTSSPSPLEQGSSASIRSQKSFEQLSSAAAGVKASLRQHKKHALARVSSNPSLKSSTNVSLPSPPSPPPPLPTAKVDQDGSWEAATATQGRESKRRPSLPSIVERAARLSSSPATASHHLPAIDPGPPESIEVLSYDSSAKDNLFFPPPSPSRTTLRLTGKRSLTGLLRKATGMAHDGAPPSADLNPPLSAMPRSNTVQERSSSGTLPSPLAPVRRARSKSNDLFANPFLGHPARTNMSNTPPSQSSPSSSSENVNGHANKQTSPALHAFRPRKSSNLSNTTNSSTLTSHGPSEDDTTSKPVFHPTIPTRSLTVEHGRKRAQSTTSVPKRVGPMHDTGPTYTPSQLSPEESYEDAQEFLNFSLPSAKEKSGQSSRFRSMISSNNNRSPLMTQKLLADEGIDLRSSHPSSPSFGTQPLRSRESNSSLISSASSTNANLKQQQSLPPPPPPKSTTRIMPEEESTRASSATRGHRSASNAESVTSKPSTSSLRSFGATLTAQEQAQAILRSADGGGSITSADGTTISLTQMLAAYGEALAQERKGSIGSNGSSSSIHLRKQASLASLGSSTRNHQLPIVNEHSRSSKPPGNSETLTGTSIRLNQTGSLTPISTPPDSPLTTRSRAESSATSFSRSPSSHRQKATPRGMQELVTGECGCSCERERPLTDTTSQPIRSQQQVSSSRCHAITPLGRTLSIRLFATPACTCEQPGCPLVDQDQPRYQVDEEWVGGRRGSIVYCKWYRCLLITQTQPFATGRPVTVCLCQSALGGEQQRIHPSVSAQEPASADDL